jgi:K+-sensing histidine kinase KdpD
MSRISFRISPSRFGHAMASVAVVLALTVMMVLIGPKLLGEGVIALLYLAPIGWCTMRWGKLAGVSAAITAALSFDYLFIPPYGTFNIGSLEGWLLLFFFIAAAILVVGRIQSILDEEQARERKATFLYEMVADIARQQTREGIAGSIASQFEQKYLVELVQVHLNGKGAYPPVFIHQQKGSFSQPLRKPDHGLAIISGTEMIGEIDLWKGQLQLPAQDDPMVQTLLHQTAAALERVQAGKAQELQGLAAGSNH